MCELTSWTEDLCWSANWLEADYTPVCSHLISEMIAEVSGDLRSCWVALMPDDQLFLIEVWFGFHTSPLVRTLLPALKLSNQHLVFPDLSDLFWVPLLLELVSSSRQLISFSSVYSSFETVGQIFLFSVLWMILHVGHKITWKHDGKLKQSPYKDVPVLMPLKSGVTSNQWLQKRSNWYRFHLDFNINTAVIWRPLMFVKGEQMGSKDQETWLQ